MMSEPHATQPGSGYRLPPEAYHQPDWLALEQRDLFPATWNYVGTVAELAEIGAYLTATVGTHEVLVIRDDGGEIRAFHNVCRHRGSLLVRGTGECAAIRCPYHGWQYGTDGALRLVPQSAEQFPDLAKSDWGLLPVACEIWMGLVFVNPANNAAPLDEWLAGVDGTLGRFDASRLSILAEVDFSLTTNWKFYLENHIDWYHLWYTHAESLGSVPHHSGVQQWHGPHWTSFTPTGEELAEGISLAPIPWVPRELHGIGAHLVFPNLLIFTGAEYFGIGQILPSTPSQSRFRFRLMGMEGGDPTTFMAGFSYIAETEDAEMASRLQATVASPAFAVGPMAAAHEANIPRYHDRYLEILDR